MNTRMAGICWSLVVLSGTVFGQGLQGTCTIDVPDGGGALGMPPGEPVAGALSIGAPIQPGSVVQSDPGNWVALRLETASEAAQPSAAVSAQVAVYLAESSRLVVCPGGESRPHLQLQQGLAVISYEPGAGGAGVLVSTASGWVRLERGTVAVTAAAEASDFALLTGQGSRFAGAIPADAAAATGGTAFEVQADTPLAQRGAALAARVTRAGVAQASEFWLADATKGDLTPSLRQKSTGAAEVRAVQAPGAQVTPPSVSTASLTGVVTLAPLTSNLNVAQALLISGNPASVIVGARLERTRIVGTTGSLNFNPLVRPPLRLAGE